MAKNVELGYTFELLELSKPYYQVQCNECLHVFMVNADTEDNTTWNEWMGSLIPVCPNCGAKTGDDQEAIG